MYLTTQTEASTQPLKPSLQNNYNKLYSHKKYLHTCRDRLRHGYSCVFFFASGRLRACGAYSFYFSPLPVLFKALLALESPTPSSEREVQERLTTPLRSSTREALRVRAR